MLRVPITDGSVPRDRHAVNDLVAKIHGIVERGDNVVIHCGGGLGRTGLVAACCLVDRGCSPVEAIRAVRAARPRTLETDEQERFVYIYAEPPLLPKLLSQGRA